MVKTPMFEQVMGGGTLKHENEEKTRRAREKNPIVGLLGKGSSTHMVGSSPLTPSN